MRVHKWLLCIGLLLGALAALTACGGGSFELGSPAEEPVVVQGESTEIQLELDRHGGFTGTVDLSVEGVPEGVEATLEPESTDNTESTLRLVAEDDAPIGSHAVTLRGQSGRLDEEFTFTLQIDPRPDFQVLLEQPEIRLEQGETAPVSITVERQGGFTDEVDLELAEVAEGLTAELVPGEDDTAVLYLDTERDTPAGDYTALLVGRSEERERSAELIVTVEAVPGFDLTADPSSVQLERDGAQEIAVLIERWAGFEAPVHLEVVDGLPGGVQATLEPRRVEGNTSTLTLSASETARLGSYTLTVRGTADELTEEIPIDMIVVRRTAS
ncbi:MAG: hypothetical protein R6U88_05000 [Candidatus Bipolaricaulota bacterium]